MAKFWLFSRLFSSFTESSTQSNFETMKENMDETVAHVAMKTGLKRWHVVMAIIRKSPKKIATKGSISFYLPRVIESKETKLLFLLAWQ